MQSLTNKVRLYYGLYIIGLFCGFTLTLLATWADFESTVYGFFHRTNNRFDGLSCPVLMTSSETNSFGIKVTNLTDRRLSPAVRVAVSTPASLYSTLDSFSLAPGETKELTWNIGPENIDMGHFIFAQGYVYSFYPIPDSENSCGIFVVNLPGTGVGIVWGMVGASLLGMGCSLYWLGQLRGYIRSSADKLSALSFLSVVTVIGLITTFIGWWVQGVFILVVIVLLIIIILGSFITHAPIEYPSR